MTLDLKKGLCFCIFFASAQFSQASSLEKIVFAAPTTLCAAIPYIAQEKNYFREEGIDLEEKLFSSGREALTALLAKHAQLQSVSETPFLHAVNQGKEIVMIANICDNSDVRFIGRKDRGIKTEKDIKGKKIATQPGTNSDFFLHSFLESNGLKKEEVTILNMTAPEMKVALVAGAIDGYFAWQPHIYYAKKELKENAVEFEPGLRYQGVQTLNMNRDFAIKNPKVIKGVLKALIRAEEFIQQHPQEAVTLVAKKLSMDEDAAKEIWKTLKFTVSIRKEALSVFNTIGNWSAKINDLPSRNYKQSIFSEPLKELRPQSVDPELASK